MFFKIFINYINSEIESTLSKCVNDTKMWGTVNILEGQRDLGRLEQWAQLNCMKFNKSNCKVLHLGQGNPHYQYKLGDERIEHCPAKKDMGVLMDGKLDMRQQCPSPESQMYPGWHQKKRGQLDKGGDPAPPLCADETSFRVLCPVTESSGQEKAHPSTGRPQK